MPFPLPATGFQQQLQTRSHDAEANVALDCGTIACGIHPQHERGGFEPVERQVEAQFRRSVGSETVGGDNHWFSDQFTQLVIQHPERDGDRGRLVGSSLVGAK